MIREWLELRNKAQYQKESKKCTDTIRDFIGKDKFEEVEKKKKEYELIVQAELNRQAEEAKEKESKDKEKESTVEPKEEKVCDPKAKDVNKTEESSVSEPAPSNEVHGETEPVNVKKEDLEIIVEPVINNKEDEVESSSEQPDKYANRHLAIKALKTLCDKTSSYEDRLKDVLNFLTTYSVSLDTTEISNIINTSMINDEDLNIKIFVSTLKLYTLINIPAKEEEYSTAIREYYDNTIKHINISIEGVDKLSDKELEYVYEDALTNDIFIFDEEDNAKISKELTDILNKDKINKQQSQPVDNEEEKLTRVFIKVEPEEPTVEFKMDPENIIKDTDFIGESIGEAMKRNNIYVDTFQK